MDYKGLAKSLVACARLGDCKNCIYNGVGMGCSHEIKNQAAAAITELLDRAERAEKQLAERNGKSK